MSAVEAAERAILGIVLAHPDHAGKAFARVALGDFTGPNALIAEALHGMRLARKGIDPALLVGELTRRGTLGRVGGAPYVHTLLAAYATAELLDAYADEVVRAARLRRAHALGLDLAQRAEKPDADPARIARTAVEQGQALLDATDADGDITTPVLAEFLGAEDPQPDWVIPGLLERGDRLVITGSEGLGKSVLNRQLAVTAAAGVHPFTGRLAEPQRVLYVDAENGPAHLRRELRPLALRARTSAGQAADENLYLESRPEGLDLTRPEDEAWLVRRVAALQPALLLIGPLYRLHAADPNKEEPARQVARVLDRCRAAANCALIAEAHAGHAVGTSGDRNMRPTGTSLWLRWPEFGYGMRPGKDYDPRSRMVDFLSWRGDRAARSWPRALRAGGAWPWSEATPAPSEWDVA